VLRFSRLARARYTVSLAKQGCPQAHTSSLKYTTWTPPGLGPGTLGPLSMHGFVGFGTDHAVDECVAEMFARKVKM
jgi:hypothetical protein